jgi:hypothetical protein
MLMFKTHTNCFRSRLEKMASAGLDKLAHRIEIWISNANQRLLFLDQEIEEKRWLQ